MKGLPQRTVLLLILLLPSQVVCGICLTGWCPMQAELEAAKTVAKTVPVEIAEPAACHHGMADSGSADQGAIAAPTLRPDCCAATAAATTEAEAPAVLTASAAVFLIEAAAVLDAAPEAASRQRSRWSPPPRHQPLYHLHSSLLI